MITSFIHNNISIMAISDGKNTILLFESRDRGISNAKAALLYLEENPWLMRIPHYTKLDGEIVLFEEDLISHDKGADLRAGDREI